MNQIPQWINDAGQQNYAYAQDIANRQNVSVKRARAILAAGARNASAKAKRANPNLLKVSGVKK